MRNKVNMVVLSWNDRIFYAQGTKSIETHPLFERIRNKKAHRIY
jgi:hypothetical protein